MQQARHMCCIIVQSVECLAIPYFSTHLINGTIFGKKKKKKSTEHGIFILIFSTTFFILRTIQWDTIIIVHRSSHKVSIIFVIFE
jgi:hypothetical protein